MSPEVRDSLSGNAGDQPQDPPCIDRARTGGSPLALIDPPVSLGRSRIHKATDRLGHIPGCSCGPRRCSVAIAALDNIRAATPRVLATVFTGCLREAASATAMSLFPFEVERPEDSTSLVLRPKSRSRSRKRSSSLRTLGGRYDFIVGANGVLTLPGSTSSGIPDCAASPCRRAT